MRRHAFDGDSDERPMSTLTRLAGDLAIVLPDVSTPLDCGTRRDGWYGAYGIGTSPFWRSRIEFCHSPNLQRFQHRWSAGRPRAREPTARG